MVNLLLAAALAGATPALPPAAPVQDDPAMFVVRDADTTVYIFGTFHALDGNSEWFRDEVRTAFEQSNELVLETLVPKFNAFRAARPLNAPSVTPSASFLATTRMAIDAGRAKGMKVANGADMVLRDTADAEGKPVAGLETLESQLNMFARMPATSAARAPRAGEPVDGSAVDKLSKTMADM